MSNGYRSTLFWLAIAGATLIAVYLLRAILLPFVAGMAVAYFLDPLADRLERLGLSRTLATAAITLTFMVGFILAAVVIAPLLVDQVAHLVARAPDALNAAVAWGKPLVAKLTAGLGRAGQAQLSEAAAGLATDAAGMASEVLRGLWSGGMAVIGLASLMVITPVVTFYLLRDWDRMVALVDDWLPRRHADVVRGLVRDIDATIAGFVRGQASVCLILATFYALGLTLVGLDVGLIIGAGAGLFSFIPYVGALIGFVAGVGMAMVQFADWHSVAMVAGVFGAGQILEGNFLTPKLVGERIGLHPVWVMFALLAGGALFGFLGLLLAVPTAAVIGVLARFGLRRYREGPLYKGGSAPAP